MTNSKTLQHYKATMERGNESFKGSDNPFRNIKLLQEIVIAADNCERSVNEIRELEELYHKDNVADIPVGDIVFKDELI